MSTVFLTGATGLIGSNIAALLVEQGHEVRALVRPGSDAQPLEALGVKVCRGDVTAYDDVLASADGAEYVIHSAAVLGGPSQSIDEHQAVNVVGTGNVYDAALKVGARRVVALSTTTFFDARDEPLTETSPLDLAPSTDPYTVTKRQAFLDAMTRVEQGQDIAIVISGGAFGSSPLPERSMAVPSFNQRVVAAITGELETYVDFPIPWVYVTDVAAAAISALTNGRAGERYLAFGRPEDVGSVPFFCNLACEVAGSSRRVTAVGGAELDDPAAAERFGPSLIALAKKRFPQPFFVNDLTVSTLAYQPLGLREGLAITIPWLKECSFLG